MTGNECVAIACDHRFGYQNKLVSTDCEKVRILNDRCLVGLVGMTSDCQTIFEKLLFRAKIYSLIEEREMAPDVTAKVLSNMLYERRFGPWFMEPVVTGFTEEGKPFLYTSDLIGAGTSDDRFACAGTCVESMLGMAEAVWKPNMDPDQLFETISQAFMAALDRDCLSGWGVTVHVLTKKELITRKLKARMD